MPTRQQISEVVERTAAGAGFELAGIAPVSQEDWPEPSAFVEWIQAGHAGEMKYMEQRNPSGELRRASLKHAAPWARSVVVCALNYNTAKPYSTQVHNARRGWISRYAWGSRDYHDALLPRLRQVENAVKDFAASHAIAIETRSYVDTGPIQERLYAKYAGIGWIGKNTCMIHPKLGSWLFLGVILTSLEIDSVPPLPDRCGSCTRCIDACPTQAIVAPGKLDARRCIAYLTIEKRGTIAEELRAPMGQHVFGCDICQDVCPWNNKTGNAPASVVPEFQARERLFQPGLRWLAGMDESAYREQFRGSPVRRAKRSGLRRNVAVAMGNSGDREFVPDLKAMAEDADPVVAEHARWAIKKLGGA
ncbi:MAG TPA: tRNA epoxyqueuosine(34) reductase QueG [Candidatus Angelobacter sp.]|nr:tRNA epoxyqueuosine(34) reductase QueG [Candidatus Angelobacter sp.]